MRIFDPHAHMTSRTTDDYEAMAASGVKVLVEPAFWLGQPRTSVGSFVDYFNSLLGWERFRAAQFGIRHHCTIGLNPKEANDDLLRREVIDILPRFLAKDGVVAVGEIGFDAMTPAEDDALKLQLELAVEHELAALPPIPPVPATRSDVGRTGMVRQWWLLTQRNVDVLLRNRLTLAVLLGSPVLVTAMMATLFQRGAFDPHGAADLGPAQIVFWIAFAGFFFGLTYGLLQIVGEMAVFRQERLAGLSVGAYVASKVTALLPVLAGVSALLLGVLRALGRLPAVGWDVSAVLFVTIVIEATSALALGSARLGRGLQRRAGRPRPADALLPSGSVRRSHRPG